MKARKLTRYRTLPKKVFREWGLGTLVEGHIKVLAGFRFAWWDPFGSVIPLFVNARVLRVKTPEVHP